MSKNILQKAIDRFSYFEGEDSAEQILDPTVRVANLERRVTTLRNLFILAVVLIVLRDYAVPFFRGMMSSRNRYGGFSDSPYESEYMDYN